MRRCVWWWLSPLSHPQQLVRDGLGAAQAGCCSTRAGLSGPLQYIDESFLSKPQRGRSPRRVDGAHDAAAPPLRARAGDQRQRHPVTAIHDEESAPDSPHANREQMRLNKSIKQCGGAASLMALLREHAAQLNPMHISAAMAHMAHMAQSSSGTSHQQGRSSDSARRPVPQGTWLEQEAGHQGSGAPDRMVLQAALLLLARCARQQLGQFRARQLSNCCWGAAKLANIGAVDRASAEALCSMLMEHAGRPDALEGATAAELSALAWSAYIMRAHSTPLLDGIARAALLLPLSSFSDHDVVNVLVAFAAAKYPQPQLFDVLCSGLLAATGPLDSGAVAASRLGAMDARLVQKLAFACAATKYLHDGLTCALAARSRQVLEQLSAVQLCGLVASLASLHCTDQELYHCAGARIEAALRGGALPLPMHVAQLMAAVAAGGGLHDAWGRSLMQAAMPTLLKCSSVNDTARAAVALAAYVGAGSCPEAARSLLAMCKSLAPSLMRVSTALLAALITSLPAAMPGLAAAAAAAGAAQAGEPSSASAEQVGAEPAGATVGVEPAGAGAADPMPAFTAALRSAALSRLAEFSAEAERAAVLKALVRISEFSEQGQEGDASQAVVSGL